MNINIGSTTEYNAVSQKDKKQKNANPSFSGMKSAILNTFSSDKANYAFKSIQNPTNNLLFVNLSSMVVPRIVIDSFRNKYAAAETAFYEIFSTVTNYFVPGAVAIGVASLMGKGDKLGIKTTNWIDNKSIDKLSEVYQNNFSNQNKTESYVKHILKNSTFGEENRNLNEDLIEKNSKSLINIINGKSEKSELKNIANELANSVGVFDNVKLVDKDKNTLLSTSLDKLLEHTVNMGQEFNKAKTKTDIGAIASKLKKINNTKTAASLAVVCALGFSAQFINRRITKLRTGKDEFVGYKDFGQNVSKSNNQVKENSDSNPSFKGKLELPSLEFSNNMPSTNQLKYVVYPFGIAGRYLSVRNSDELREVAIKTTFAFANFLIIPNLMKNLAANWFDNKNVFNGKIQSSEHDLQGKSGLSKFFKRLSNINNLNIKSYNDINAFANYEANKYSKLEPENLLKELKDNKIISNPDNIVNDIKNLNSKEKVEKIAKAITKELSGIKNASTFAGILYSCLTLGVGINIINQIMTNKKRAKQLEKLAHNKPEYKQTQDLNQVKNSLNQIDNKSKQVFSSFISNQLQEGN